MKTLTTSQINKISKAEKMLKNAMELLKSVKNQNNEVRYSSNINILFNNLDTVISIVAEDFK